jgi:hypothetical protein
MSQKLFQWLSGWLARMAKSISIDIHRFTDARMKAYLQTTSTKTNAGGDAMET